MANEEVLTEAGTVRDSRPRLRDHGPLAHPHYRFHCVSVVNCIYTAIGYGSTVKEAYHHWHYEKMMIKIDDDFHLPKLTRRQRLAAWIEEKWQPTFSCSSLITVAVGRIRSNLIVCLKQLRSFLTS